MNQFEQKLNALRLEDKAIRAELSRERDRRFTEINRRIAATDDAELKLSLKQEKSRIYRETRTALKWQYRCHHQQRELLEQQYEEYRRNRTDVSWRMANEAMRTLYRFACQKQDSPQHIAISFEHECGRPMMSVG